MNTRQESGVKTFTHTARTMHKTLTEGMKTPSSGIPQFPQFKHLELEDRAEIVKYTSKYVPYSDFNFTSLWSWDTDNDFMISLLNGNLVIRFIDYVAETPFLSFIGNAKIEETIEDLIGYAEVNQIDCSLRLVPEESLNGLEKGESKYCIEGDRDNFDYMLAVEKLIEYRGNKLRGKRNFAKRFNTIYSPVSHEIDIRDPIIQKELLTVVNGWSSEKNAIGEDTNKKEAKAIAKALYSNLPDIVSVGFYVNGSMVGFVIGEVLRSGYAMLHFEKAISQKYVGIYPFMIQKFAKILASKGVEYINYEQDLGLPGLRKSKESYQPLMVKKYSIAIR